jgi:flagellin
MKAIIPSADLAFMNKLLTPLSLLKWEKIMDIRNTNSFSGIANSINTSINQISSGQKVNTASDSPSSIQLIEQLNSQIKGNSSAYSNVINGVSAVQTAQGGLNQVTDSLQQLRELGIQAGNGTLNNSDRQAIQKSANELLSGIKDSLVNSKFNGNSLLASSESANLQIGSSADSQQALPSFDLLSEFNNINLFELSFNSGDISETLNNIDQALNITGSAQGTFGSVQNSLERTADGLTSANVNQAQSRSNIKDTDYAAAITELAKQQLSEEVGISLLAQANANRGQVLQLLKT